MKAKLESLLARLKSHGLTGIHKDLLGTPEWEKHCYADKPEDSADAYQAVLDWMDENLSQKKIEAIHDEESEALLYSDCNEIMQEDISPLGTAQKLDRWVEAGAVQDAFNERLAMYHNEY